MGNHRHAGGSLHPARTLDGQRLRLDADGGQTSHRPAPAVADSTDVLRGVRPRRLPALVPVDCRHRTGTGTSAVLDAYRVVHARGYPVRGRGLLTESHPLYGLEFARPRRWTHPRGFNLLDRGLAVVVDDLTLLVRSSSLARPNGLAADRTAKFALLGGYIDPELRQFGLLARRIVAERECADARQRACQSLAFPE